MKKFNKTMLLLITMLTILLSYNITLANHMQKRILFINSYSPSFFATTERMDSFSSILPDAIYDIEFMDTKRFNDDDNLKNFYNLLKYKISNSDKYDIVIITDDNAYDFAKKYQDELFKDIPIVFFGVNNIYKATDANDNPMITGIVEDISMHDTIDVAFELIPNATRIVAITDGTNTCKPFKEQFYNISKFHGDVNFEEFCLDKMSYEKLFKKVKELDKNTVLLFLSAFTDVNGKTLEYDRQVSQLVENSAVPVFHLWENGIPGGILGGKVVSHSEQGKCAGLIAKDILDGKSVETMDVITVTPNKYIFNNDTLKRYKLDSSILPKESVLISSIDSNIYFYKKALLVLTILLSITIILILFQQRISAKRKKIQSILQEKNDELTSLYEELYASESEITQQFNRLHESHRKYELILNASHNALLDIDFDDKTINLSPNFKTVLDNDKLLSHLSNCDYMKLFSFVHPEDVKRVESIVNVIESSDMDEFNVDIRIIQNNKNYNWFNLFGKLLRGDNNLPTIMAVSISDIHQEKIVSDENKRLAYYDNLTGLPKRSMLFKEIGKKIDGNDFSDAVTLFIDIDNFKYINDTYGHEFGDLMLREIGDRLRLFENDSSFVSRIGGDEFVLFLDGKKDDALKIIDELYKAFSKPISVNNKNLYVNISIGGSVYPRDGLDLNTLLINSDLAMYKAKSQGKDTYLFFEESMKDEMQTKSVLHNELRNAIANDELMLHYQPKYDLNDNNITSYEALLRWNNKSFGFISPAKFIPLAEETGLILEISQWVLFNACQFIKRTGSMVSVNVSPVELTNITYLDNVKNIIEQEGIDPHLLGLEVTENALVENFNLVVEILQGLINYGVRVYLDDFGKGYSSLNYLRRLPINYLKIDKSFVDDIVHDKQAKFIIDTIISIAHNLNLKVIAEGVETQEQMDTLKELNCDQVQGYLLSRPLSEEDLLTKLNVS